jgi:uncharacterized RDD family membrane protein YckC
MAEERALEQQAERWRDEVSSRIEGYKQKKSRKQLSGEFSMRFEWEQSPHSPRAAQAAALAPELEAAWSEPEDVIVQSPGNRPEQSLVTPEPEKLTALLEEAAAIIEAAQSSVPMSGAAPAEAPERKPPEPAPPARRLRNTNLIEFPRLPFMPPPPDELAEPVMDTPRILDVPDEIVQELAEERTPLGDIALEPHADESAVKPEFDVGPQVAPLSLRFAAALLDAMVVIAACGLFMVVAQAVAPGMPHNRMAIAVGLAAPALIWSLYQYVFLRFGLVTPGMRLTRLHVRTFDGERASEGRRHWRALAMMLSFMPLGIGLAWALADEDMLCWHDRITRTYLARE